MAQLRPGGGHRCVVLRDECGNTGFYTVNITSQSTEQIDVIVTDTANGVRNTYTNPRGSAFEPARLFRISCGFRFR